MELKNQSTKQNATRCPLSLPFQSSIILANHAVFRLQNQQFKWIQNDGNILERLEKMCSSPVIYLSSNNVENLVNKSPQKPHLKDNNAPTTTLGKSKSSCQNIRRSPSPPALPTQGDSKTKLARPRPNEATMDRDSYNLRQRHKKKQAPQNNQVRVNANFLYIFQLLRYYA